MSPLITIICVACCFTVASAPGQIPEPLQKLDVNVTSFPEKAAEFLASPEAAALSAQDAFYLLGASHMIHPPEATRPSFPVYQQMQERIREFAWSKARSSGAPSMTRLAEEWKQRPRLIQKAIAPAERLDFQAMQARLQRERQQREAEQKLRRDAVLSYAESTGAVLDFAASEAIEWAQLGQLEAHVAKLADLRPRVVFPDPPALPVDLLRGVPPNLAEATQAFSRVVLPCLTRHPSLRPGGALDLAGREDARWIQTRLALTEGVAAAKRDDVDRKSKMVGVCGTVGWPDLPRLAEIPPLIRMLEDRDWVQAAGYAFLFGFRGNSDQGTARAFDLVRAVITNLVPDWERAALGREIAEGSIARQIDDYTMPGWFHWLPYASDEQVLRACLEWIHWAETLPWGVRYRATEGALLDLLDARRALDGKMVSRPVRSRPLPLDLRRQVVALYAAPMNPTGPIDRILFGLDVLSLVDSDVTRGRLREFLQHPSATVANRAARGLRAFGEAVPDRPNKFPLLASFTLDGEPVRKQPIYWSRRYRDRNNNAHANAESGVTDENGQLQIPRDYFHGVTQPHHPSLLVFMRQERGRAKEGSITLAYAIPWPPSLDEPLEFSAETVRPVLRITEARGYSLKQPATLNIHLRSPVVAHDVRLPVEYRKDSTSLGDIELPAMQAGKWEVTVRAHTPPGVWQGVVELTPNLPRANIKLSPGTRVEIDGWESSPEFPWYSALELFQGAKPLEPLWDLSGSGKTSLLPLPPGIYRLRLPSSTELHEKLGYHVAPESPPFDADEKRFTISASTGPHLSIGAFQRKPSKSRDR